MKKTTLSIILLVTVILAVMLVGCSQSTSSASVAQDNAASPSLEPINGSKTDVSNDVIPSYIKPYDEDPAETAYRQAFQEANERWPWAERAPKARYASLAADYADAYLIGDDSWSAQSADLMAEITAELDQSQAEILALRDSGQDSPRLDPYNLGHAEAGGGPNDDSGPGPSPTLD